MKNSESKETQYQKIWDAFDGGILYSGLSLLLSVIYDPSMWIENLSIGVPCIIYGAAKIISWKNYYVHRISILKWDTIFLVCIFLVSTAFFLIPFEYIQEKVRLYLLSTITIILLIIISVKKRNQLSDMRG